MLLVPKLCLGTHGCEALLRVLPGTAWEAELPERRSQAELGNQKVSFVMRDSVSLLPLFANDFLSLLPEKRVRALVPRWRKHRANADDEVKCLGIDLFLHAVAERLGQKDEQQAAARRIAVNPAQREILGEKGVSGLLDGMRQAPEIIRQMKSLFH